MKTKQAFILSFLNLMSLARMKISRRILFFSDYIPKASELYYQMIVKRGIIKQLQKQAKNVLQIHYGFK